MGLTSGAQPPAKPPIGAMTGAPPSSSIDMIMTDGRIVIDGIGLQTRHIGPPPSQAPTLVLLHEGLGSITMWGDFPQNLAAATGLGVFVFARQGYGQSDPCRLPRPFDYMQREARDVLPKVLDAIGFRRGLLVGHSDGASIAALYLGTVADHRVRGLVLMAPHFFVEDLTIASIVQAKAAYDTGDLRARLARHHGDNVDCAFRGWNDAWLDPGFRAWDISDVIAYIRVPMLIVQGRDDVYGTLAQVTVAEAEAYCPVEVAMLDGCGHSPHREKPAETLAAVNEFVGRLADDLASIG